MKKSTLRVMLIASLSLHALVAIILFYRSNRPSANALKGVVSVDFIQSVKHEEGTGPAASKRNGPSSPTPPSKPVGDPQGEARASDAYVLLVTELINSKKIYPKRAIDREEEGRVVVAITLSRDGRILETKIEEASPFDSLNEAALATIRAVARFPELPAPVGEPMHLHIPLVFRLER